MDNSFDISVQNLEPAYDEPDVVVNSEISFNIDYYKSHFLPTREVVELKKASSHE